MALTSYEFYTDTYHGSAVPADAFPGAAERASEYLDALTFGKAAQAPAGAVQEAVERCCCAVADLLYAEQNKTTAGVPEGAVLKGESVGSWRREYELTPGATKTVDTKVYDLAKRYLGRWGLLYRGVVPCVQ